MILWGAYVASKEGIKQNASTHEKVGHIWDNKSVWLDNLEKAEELCEGNLESYAGVQLVEDIR